MSLPEPVRAWRRRRFLQAMGFGTVSVVSYMAGRSHAVPSTELILEDDFIQLKALSADPTPLPEGGVWFRGDSDKLRTSLDGATAVDIATGAAGAPDSADYLVGTAQAGLSAEIVVGTTPGGELGGTWDAPTVDATHSGSSHAGVVATHEAAADPHTGYQRESEKGAASGYASLGADTLVPQDQLGSGVQDGTKFLRDDGTWQNPPAGGGPPTGTGFRHVTGGVEDAAAKLVDTADVNADQITNALLADMAANTAKVNVGVLGNPEDLAIPANTVLGRKAADIVAETIITAQIADAQVTYAKIQNVSATDRLLGRDSAGAGVIEELTAAAVLAMLAAYSNCVLQAFTAPGANTYTPTAGMKHCIVISTGGGGGGGGGDASAAANVGAGAGGGAGGTCIERFTAADIGASQTVTIGAAGAAGSTAGGNGGAGGNTTFGALHTANGGAGGIGSGNAAKRAGSTAGGAGGVPTGGLLNITGGGRR